MSWYLRKKDESIFGPVEIEVLQAWATDGRVVPEDSASRDQTGWRPAHELSELEMNWNVELADGQMYGPLHLTALFELVADGSITSHSRVVHKKTEEATTLQSLINSSGTSTDIAREARRWQRRYEEEAALSEHRLAEQEKVFQDRLHFLEEELHRERATAEDARKKMQDMESQHRDILRQIRDLNERYIRLRDQSKGSPRANP